MPYLAFGLALIFAVIVGRNDGSPLVALAVRSSHRAAWWPPAVLVASVITLPALGLSAVAATLGAMFADAASNSSAGLAVLLSATIVTLLISTATGIPTSITLALVGASTGVQFTQGAVDLDRLLRVLGLAAAGPVAAWLIALLITHLITLARGPQLERRVRLNQTLAFTATAVAYGSNDAQKLLAVFAVLFGLGISEGAIDARVITLTSVSFSAGVLWGLRRSSHSLRRGVLHPKPYQVASTLWASASAVLIGSALGTPMSMTQSVTGALVGSTPPREWRRVRWEQSRRVALAWLWTLPVAAVLGWALTSVTTRLI